MICTKLLNDPQLGFTCPPNGNGYEQTAVIINYDDVDWSQFAVDSTEAGGNSVTAFVLKSGKKGFAVIQAGSQPFGGSTIEMSEGSVVNSFTHLVNFLHLNFGNMSALWMDTLSRGKFVVVLRNGQKEGAGSKYEIVGVSNGLKAASISRDPYSEDTNGGFSVSLQETGSPYSALFYQPSVEVTEAAVDAWFASLTTAAE